MLALRCNAADDVQAAFISYWLNDDVLLFKRKVPCRGDAGQDDDLYCDGLIDSRDRELVFLRKMPTFVSELQSPLRFL